MKMKLIWVYFAYLLFVWGGFRYWVALPEVVEELWFKPLIWLVPVFWWRLSMGGKPKFFEGSWMASLVWGLVSMLFYIGLIGWFRGGINVDINWSTVGVALATAAVEEMAFSGFILGYLDMVRKNKLGNLVTLAVMVMLIRVPINLWVYQLGGQMLMGVTLMSGAVALINGWMRQRTNNVMTAILARVGMMFAVMG